MMTVVGGGRWRGGCGIDIHIRCLAEKTGEIELNIEEVVGKRDGTHLYVHTYMTGGSYKLNRKI